MCESKKEGRKLSSVEIRGKFRKHNCLWEVVLVNDSI